MAELGACAASRFHSPIPRHTRGISQHISSRGCPCRFVFLPRAYARGRMSQHPHEHSQAVVTKGGRIVWLAGQVGAADASGKSLAGDFDGQVREVFSWLGQTLEQAGGTLADMVTMTVFITDARHGDRFTQLRKEIFGDNFPASALITVAGLARPEMLVEVQGIAILG